jgi:hypothetical protein
MIAEELRKYIDMVNEETANDQLFEMANISSKRHGIDNVYIWVGKAAGLKHGLRVKISNVPERMDINDSFVIQMPNLDYDPTRVARWIDAEIMNKILLWIKVNQQLLYDYEMDIINDTDDFLNQIEKV